MFSVDGQFSNWSNWSNCSVSCGGGIKYRRRECIRPKFGGKRCLGAINETHVCKDNLCPGKPCVLFFLFAKFFQYLEF